MSDVCKSAVTASQYLNLAAQAYTWVLEPLIPAGGLVNLYGPPKKARKSFFALQLMHAIAHGEPFLGMSTTQGKVLYVQIDTPRSLWQLRLRNLIESGVTLHDNMLFADSDQLLTYPFDILKPESFAWLRAQVQTHTPALVIIVTLRNAHSASEDKSESMSQVINLLRAACAPSAILMVSHSRKSVENYDAGVLHEGRGSSAVSGACDAILRIRIKTEKRPAMLDWEGRATGSAELPLEDEPNHFYKLGAEDAFRLAVVDTLARTFVSERKAAEHLSALTGRPFETCRTALRKANKERK